MKIRTNVQAGRVAVNHNHSLARAARGLAVRTAVKAGRLAGNHSQSLLGVSA